MMKLDNFIGMMTGHFDNKEQFNMMQATGKIYPYAKHVNTVCNDKINNIPHDFNGKFAFGFVRFKSHLPGCLQFTHLRTGYGEIPKKNQDHQYPSISDSVVLRNGILWTEGS